MTGELWQATLIALGEAMDAGRLSPVDLLDIYLDRISAHDGALNSFVHLNAAARAAAEMAHADIKAGRRRGPLHGLPIAVKDNYLTEDMPTKVGSAAAGAALPLRDATAVRRLREAGAVLIGKTRMHEYAWGMETPPTVNPRGEGRSRADRAAARARRLPPGCAPRLSARTPGARSAFPPACAAVSG